MKIAIHHRPGSFSDRWIEYCKNNGVDYKIVNAYDNDIVEQVSDCDAFMWHHHQSHFADTLFARQLIYSLEERGICCFPDFHTTWHFDDKIGQKYLLEAVGAPLVPSYVFYSKTAALDWIEHTTFPKVFKLRGGAGAVNVFLVHSEKEARRYVKKAFGKGFVQRAFKSLLSEDLRKLRDGKMTSFEVIKSLCAFYLKPGDYNRLSSPERGYVYFQDFVPNNTFDIRVCIVDNKAFALKRLVRKGDFRASGSGNIVFDRTQIDERCVRMAFDMNNKFKTQSIAFDFVFNEDNQPLIVEISYGFATAVYDECEGWWDHDMNWHPGVRFNFCGWMIDGVIRHVNESKQKSNHLAD